MRARGFAGANSELASQTTYMKTHVILHLVISRALTGSALGMQPPNIVPILTDGQGWNNTEVRSEGSNAAVGVGSAIASRV